MVIGLKSCYSDLVDGNYWAGSGFLATKMAAVETKTSKVPTGVKLLPYPHSVPPCNKRLRNDYLCQECPGYSSLSLCMQTRSCCKPKAPKPGGILKIARNEASENRTGDVSYSSAITYSIPRGRGRKPNQAPRKRARKTKTSLGWSWWLAVLRSWAIFSAVTKAPKLRCTLRWQKNGAVCGNCAFTLRWCGEKILFLYSLNLVILLKVRFNTSSACHILAFVGSIHSRALECFVINFIFSLRKFIFLTFFLYAKDQKAYPFSSNT